MAVPEPAADDSVLLAALESAEAAMVPALLRAAGAVLYLADYQLSQLRSVPSDPATEADQVPIEGSTLGRAFSSQTISIEPSGTGLTGGAGPTGGTGSICLAPVGVGGDRLGVLVVRSDQPSAAGLADRAARLAAAAGRAVRLTNRGTDLFEQAQRTQRLGLAAEMQWQLLPGRACAGAGFCIAGQLEAVTPAMPRGDLADVTTRRERHPRPVVQRSRRVATTAS